MAAPTLTKAEAKLTVGEQVKDKQKKEIKKHKNVLFNPFPYKWPKLDSYFEDRILDELQSVLTSLPLQRLKRPASNFKNRRQKSKKNKQLSDPTQQSSTIPGPKTPDNGRQKVGCNTGIKSGLVKTKDITDVEEPASCSQQTSADANPKTPHKEGQKVDDRKGTDLCLLKTKGFKDLEQPADVNQQTSTDAGFKKPDQKSRQENLSKGINLGLLKTTDVDDVEQPADSVHQTFTAAGVEIPNQESGEVHIREGTDLGPLKYEREDPSTSRQQASTGANPTAPEKESKEVDVNKEVHLDLLKCEDIGPNAEFIPLAQTDACHNTPDRNRTQVVACLGLRETKDAENVEQAPDTTHQPSTGGGCQTPVKERQCEDIRGNDLGLLKTKDAEKPIRHRPSPDAGCRTPVKGRRNVNLSQGTDLKRMKADIVEEHVDLGLLRTTACTRTMDAAQRISIDAGCEMPGNDIRKLDVSESTDMGPLENKNVEQPMNTTRQASTDPGCHIAENESAIKGSESTDLGMLRTIDCNQSMDVSQQSDAAACKIPDNESLIKDFKDLKDLKTKGVEPCRGVAHASSSGAGHSAPDAQTQEVDASEGTDWDGLNTSGVEESVDAGEVQSATNTKPRDDAGRETTVEEWRSLIVCGVRCVTKGLEKDEFAIIIVCRSTKPPMIISHLIPLAASRGCPALCIPEFNSTIAPLLGVTSLVVLGFKKVPEGASSVFAGFVSYAISVSLPLDVPLTNRALGMPTKQDSRKNDNKRGSVSQGSQSPKHETAVKKSNFKKTTPLEFPANGPPRFVPQKDYSHLYVYRISGNFGDSFIPLGGSKAKKRGLATADAESERKCDDVLGLDELPAVKRVKKSKSVRNVEGYVPAVVKRQIPNKNKKDNKKKQKKIKKK